MVNKKAGYGISCLQIKGARSHTGFPFTRIEGTVFVFCPWISRAGWCLQLLGLKGRLVFDPVGLVVMLPVPLFPALKGSFLNFLSLDRISKGCYCADPIGSLDNRSAGGLGSMPVPLFFKLTSVRF